MPSAAIGQIVKVNITLTIPLFTNLRTKLMFTCIDTSTGQPKQFANILSFSVISMGKNVDGLMSEVNELGLYPQVSSLTSNGYKYYENYYNDTAVLDMGVITNTGN